MRARASLRGGLVPPTTGWGAGVCDFLKKGSRQGCEGLIRGGLEAPLSGLALFMRPRRATGSLWPGPSPGPQSSSEQGQPPAPLVRAVCMGESWSPLWPRRGRCWGVGTSGAAGAGARAGAGGRRSALRRPLPRGGSHMVYIKAGRVCFPSPSGTRGTPAAQGPGGPGIPRL